MNMTDILDTIRNNFESAFPTAGFAGIYLVCLAAIWFFVSSDTRESLTERRNAGRRAISFLFSCAMLSFIFILTPLADISAKRFASEFAKNVVYAWLLPLLPALLTVTAGSYTAASEKKEAFLLTLSLVFLIFLAGASGFDPVKMRAAAGSASYGFIDYMGG